VDEPSGSTNCAAIWNEPRSGEARRVETALRLFRFNPSRSGRLAPVPVRQIGRIADLEAGAQRRRPQDERHGWRESLIAKLVWHDDRVTDVEIVDHH